MLKTLETDLDKGLNYISYDLTFDGEKADQLNAALQLKDENILKEKENGSYYLGAGDYSVKLIVGDAETTSKLKIKEPREKPKRKGSE